jgi:hypothetical protein
MEEYFRKNEIKNLKITISMREVFKSAFFQLHDSF